MKRRDAIGSSPLHLSGELHVTGRTRFVADEPRPDGMLFVKCVGSPFAHAKILSIDPAPALSSEGVRAVLSAGDIPGENQIGHAFLDEPLFPVGEAMWLGQPLAIVVADDPEHAREAAALVGVECEELPPVLSIDEALAKGDLYAPERRIVRGDVDRAWEKCDHVVEGVVGSGSQEHLYLETQVCRAVPGEDGETTLFSATQATAEVQEIAARVLGVDRKDVTVDVRRLGGAFGGKERAATIWACLAALAAFKTRRPVELRLTRHEDMRWTGKRHPFESRYKAGFNRDGRLVAYSVELNANGGAYADLSMAILERSMLHADNAYHIPNARIVGRACRTNLPPNTAFRGFGAPQGVFVIETVMDRIARRLGLDPIEVRARNAYREGQETPYGQKVHEPCHPGLLACLKKNADYTRLCRDIGKFNSNNRRCKRGIGVVPVKFGVSFTSAFLNQASALCWVYGDGTVSLSHGGIEMGQEVNTKVAQVVASVLGVTLDRIRVETSNTKRTGNASPTAATTGSDLNGNAARIAAEQILARLRPVAAGLLATGNRRKPAADRIMFQKNKVFDPRNPRRFVKFEALAHEAYMRRVALGAHGFYRTPGVRFDRAKGKGTPFYYYVFGCALAVAEVHLLTGNVRLERVHIVHETGKSLNPAIDKGQVEGAFMQGYGWATFEELVHDAKGRYLADTTSTYKIPTIKDLPGVFDVDLVVRNRKHASVFGSKGIGEPPFIYGEAAYFAIKDALRAIAPAGAEIDLPMPATPEAVLEAVEMIKQQEVASGQWPMENGDPA
ncbi:MAG: molybdopterin-dependent oxidoreductase [Deltaproteobacteria bacterium]|nr:molybdopterin-dependent oxidoreductase [Deltaproteobacteria bacterium]